MSWDVCVVATQGATLAAEARGEGKPLVLVHGLSGDRSIWDDLALALGPERRIVRYDLRGHGQSTQQQGEQFRHADDLLAVMDAFEVDRADVVGTSMGASIALNFALDHGARVRGLVLISPGIVGWEWSAEWRALWAPIQDAARSGDMGRAKELWFGHPLFASARAHATANAYLRRSIATYSGQAWLREDEAAALPDLDRLAKLAAPTLLLSGENDLAEFRLIADLIAGAAPDVTRVDVLDGGHMLPLEKPDLVIAEVERFIERA